MKISLLVKYAVSYLAVVIASLIVMNTIGTARVLKGITSDRVNAMSKEGNVIVESYMDDYYKGGTTLSEVYKELQTIDTFSDARIMIVNPDGEILSDTRGYASAEKADRITLPPSLLNNDVTTEYSDGNVEPSTVVVHPVDVDLSLRGYVVLMTARAGIKADGAYYIDTLNICFLLISLVLFAVIAILYIISIVPLRENIKMAREYADGHFEYKSPAHKRKRHDEFADLSATIEYMGNDIGQMEDYQRKFISNISHDFRSPLTSIKGFATAMKDGTIPPEMYDRYLDTIIYETERLTKLTSEILELGKFDSKAAMLKLSDFDINEMIKRTAAGMEGTCRPRGITFDLTFEAESEMVNADRDRIEQVVYNLVDNAVKFSHNDSAIEISTSEKGNKVFVSVKDHGVGIAADKIKKIWERFYKTDSSRGRDRKGSGLGLSIVKEIIQAHGEEINVVSTENAGTEFIFTLARTSE